MRRRGERGRGRGRGREGEGEGEGVLVGSLLASLSFFFLSNFVFSCLRQLGCRLSCNGMQVSPDE